MEQELITQLVEALEAAESHLDYCGWGDKWEREGIDEPNGVRTQIRNAIQAAEGVTAELWA